MPHHLQIFALALALAVLVALAALAAFAALTVPTALAAAEALAVLANINVLNLYQAMSHIIPAHSAELLAALKEADPDFANAIEHSGRTVSS